MHIQRGLNDKGNSPEYFVTVQLIESGVFNNKIRVKSESDGYRPGVDEWFL